jgi:hypothetical protein
LKRLSYLMAVSVFLLPFTAYSQDAGVSDTVKLFGDTLYIGRSAPLRLTVVNDRPMKAFLFGLVTDGSSGGFARLDSIVYVNRMADTTALNLRLGGSRDADGVSPDTMYLNAYRAGPDISPLASGNDVIAQLWMTGLKPGVMNINNGFLPPGGPFVMFPYTGDFQGKMFTPGFVSAPVQVVSGDGFVCGNIDESPDGAVDIGDLTALIDYLFISMERPGGLAMANVDGSENGIVDIGDLTVLISHLFIDFQPLTCF